MKRRCLRFAAIMVFLAISMPGLARDGWLVHLIQPQRGFESEILITNPTENSARVYFLDRGSDLPPIAIDARSTLAIQSARLSDASHLRYRTEHELIDVSIRYTAVNSNTPLTVSTDRDPAQVHRYRFPPESSNWLGLAVVNAGRVPGPVTVKQYSDAHRLLFEKRLIDRLGAGEKLLHLISELEWVNRPSYFEIVSDQPLCSVILSGHPRTGDLDELSPVTTFRNKVVARVTGGFLGLDETVRIQDGTIQFLEVSRPFSELDRVLETLDSMGASDLRIQPVPDPCCDMKFYSLIFVRGDVRNEFHFSDMDLEPDRPETRSGLDAMRYLFELAEGYTEEDALAF